MISIIKKAVLHGVQNDSIWAILNATIIRIAEYAKWARKYCELIQKTYIIENALKSISPNLTVKHGPFKGMVYPEKMSVGSTLCPKLLGSYERELHPVIEKIRLNKYSEIVDIG
jgi:hypothetical protein